MMKIIGVVMTKVIGKTADIAMDTGDGGIIIDNGSGMTK
jgi:hypothetical protein